MRAGAGLDIVKSQRDRNVLASNIGATSHLVLSPIF